MIFYGGTKRTVEIQLSCQHEWHVPCRDSISHYQKCEKCFCVDRDCTESEYYGKVTLGPKTFAQSWQNFIEAIQFQRFIWWLLDKTKTFLNFIIKHIVR